MRRSLLAVLSSAIMLLVVAVGAGMAARANTLASQRTALAQRAAVESQLLDDYFRRASALIDVTARNPSFVDYYSIPGNPAQRAYTTGTVMDRVVDALAYLGRMYPGQTGRASFIDISGAENVRVVAGQKVDPSLLGSDRGNSEYFTPTFKLPHGVVHQSKPYLSRELNAWVISSGTQVFMPDWIKHAMVHIEVPLESFRSQSSADGYGQLLIVDQDSGAVVMDASRPVPRGGGPYALPDQRFVQLVRGWDEDGSLILGGRQVVYHRVPAEVGNANHWYAVAVAPDQVTILTSIGWLPTSVALAAFLVIIYAVTALRRAQHALVVAANTDPLTGLQNRRRLVSDLNRLAPQATPDRPLLLVLSDLNRFKAYNDTFGHPEGDRLLVRLATALTSALGSRGTAYRIGGDEFCVLARLDRSSADATVGAVADALRDDQRSVVITASHGTLILPDETSDPNEAMRLVDIHMYQQKRHRRSTDDLEADVADASPRPADASPRPEDPASVPRPEDPASVPRPEDPASVPRPRDGAPDPADLSPEPTGGTVEHRID